MQAKLYAHSVPHDSTRDKWEKLSEHLQEVGKMAAEFANPFGRAAMARAAGLLHDIGKVSEAYQSYIAQPPDKITLRGPDHSTAGARSAIDLYGPMLGRLLAYGIAGHHGGLMNGREGGRTLNKRLSHDYPIENYDGWKDHAGPLPTASELMAGARPTPNPAYPGFEDFFLIRMLFSCLVDSDFLATEHFYSKAEGLPPPNRGGIVSQALLDALDGFLSGKRKSDTALNCLRSEILDHVIQKAAMEPGLFTLTVPTGGGKTLASLNFALEHALRWGKKRVIYVIPFTSIIEQTAGVFRSALGDDTAILEHHANFDWDPNLSPKDDVEGEGREGLAKLRRDAENWDAPIIVTTAVQFFESLFAHRTSRCRKLHNIANSVIILDEAQTMPVHLLRPCMAALDELARNYGATIVLCTATQPALRQQDKALPLAANGVAEGFNIIADRELAPRPTELYEELKRVKMERRGITDDAIIAERFANTPQMLCIVNSRRHARELFDRIADQKGARHLTTLMCAKHRQTILADIRVDLDSARPVRLIATSLIEAGVDIDFPEVWRAAAGLDSIAQAAGRCNREGRLGTDGKVVIFEAEGRPNPPVIEAFWQAARGPLDRALKLGQDPLGLATIHAYFQELYFQKQFGALDAASVQGEAYPIIPAIRKSARELAFPFETISDAFRLIDDVMQPVLVPYDDLARQLFDTLEAAPVPPAGILRKLQHYSVSVPKHSFEAMLKFGAVQPIKPDIYGMRFMRLINDSLYDPRLGLSLEDPVFRSSEANFF